MPEEMALTPHFWQYQIDLAEVLGRHRTDLSLYNVIIDITGKHSNGPDFKFSSDDLVKRKGLIRKLEVTYDMLDLKRKNVDVKLTTGQTVSMSFFDAKAMIMSLLNNDDLKKNKNLPTGNDVY